MTRTLDRGGARSGEPEPASIPIPSENTARNLYAEPPRPCAGEDEAGQEESLVADPRSGLTPSQTVDEKLAVVLGAVRGGHVIASGDQHARRISGSREGPGPVHPAPAAQAADAVLDPG